MLFWEKNWKKVNATAMFNEVDDDQSGEVTFAKWVSFWENVVAQPDYSEVCSTELTRRTLSHALCPYLVWVRRLRCAAVRPVATHS